MGFFSGVEEHKPIWRFSLGIIFAEDRVFVDLFGRFLRLPLKTYEAADLPHAWQIVYVDATLFVVWRERVFWFAMPWRRSHFG